MSGKLTGSIILSAIFLANTVMFFALNNILLAVANSIFLLLFLVMLFGPKEEEEQEIHITLPIKVKCDKCGQMVNDEENCACFPLGTCPECNRFYVARPNSGLPCTCEHRSPLGIYIDGLEPKDCAICQDQQCQCGTKLN